MERFLLDSSAIIEILSGTAEGKRAATAVRSGEVATSAIAYCEVLNKANLDKLQIAEAFLNRLLVLYPGQAELKTCCGIQQACNRKGRHVPTIDALIAATAINAGCTLVSFDGDFGRIEGLKKLAP